MAQVPSTARIRQRRRQRLLMILLLILMLGGAAAYLFLRPEPPKAEVQPPGTVAVPAAGREIPMGTTVSMRRHIRLRYMKPMEVPPDALLKPWQFDRRVAVRTIAVGDYLRDADLSPPGAPNGYSGLAKPGTRVLVVETKNIKGTLDYLRQGDHIDVLSIGGSAAASNVPRPRAVTREAGGSGPGAAHGPRTGTGTGTGMPPQTRATLIAEDAVVLVAPSKSNVRGKDAEYVVLQMQPGDAHVAALALGSGASLRFVFRPFNESVRVTESVPLEQNIYPPVDPRNVEMIEGTARTMQRASMDDD